MNYLRITSIEKTTNIASSSYRIFFLYKPGETRKMAYIEIARMTAIPYSIRYKGEVYVKSVGGESNHFYHHSIVAIDLEDVEEKII